MYAELIEVSQRVSQVQFIYSHVHMFTCSY